MNRQLVVMAVTGAVVLAGCARMMAQQPKSEPMQSSGRQMQVQMTEMPAEEAPRAAAPRPAAPKAQAPKPKPKAVPRTSQPRR